MKQSAIFCALMFVGLFTTAFAEPVKEKPLFTFAVAADPHLSDNRAGEPTGIEKFKRLVQKVEALAEKPDFLMLAGDLHVDRLPQAITESKVKIPLHVVPGNHEHADSRKALEKMFPADFKGKDFYSFVHKECLFVGLADAAGNGDHVGHLDSEAIRGQDQGEWLRKTLANHRGKVKQTFIIAHIPPNPDGRAQTMHLAANDQKFLRDLAGEYKPITFFFGHLHRRWEFPFGPAKVYVAPSVNWNFEGQAKGFYHVKVYPTRVEVEFVKL